MPLKLLLTIISSTVILSIRWFNYDKSTQILSRKVFSLVGILLISSLLCFLPIFIFLYPAYPWPAPNTYPNVKTSLQKSASGSWGIVQHQIYTVSVPLANIENHYEKEMGQYCINNYAFEQLTDENSFTDKNKWNLPKLPEYLKDSVCYKAECQVRRVWLPQYFEVLTCAKSEEETIVVQVDSWED